MPGVSPCPSGIPYPGPAVSPLPASPNSSPSDVVTMTEYIPQTAVITEPVELAKLDPLFASQLQSDDLLQYVVSWSFNGTPYLIGFVYKHDGSDMVCNRIIGFKKVSAGYEQAFVSSRFENPDKMIGEDFTDFESIGAEAYELGDYLIVKTNEFLSEDFALCNIFLLSGNGLVDNKIGNSSLFSRCQITQCNGKLLYQDEFWNEVTVQNDKLMITHITDFLSYVPATNENDFVVNLLAFKDKDFNSETQRPVGENYITMDINNGQKVLTKKNFIEKEEEYAEWGGTFMDYELSKPLNMKKGGRIILLYPPLIKMYKTIYPEERPEDNSDAYMDLPGVVMITPESSGTYSIEIGSENSFYHLTIKVT